MVRAYTIHPTEMNKLDALIGAAIVQPALAQRLLSHDPSIANEFGLSHNTWLCLSQIEVTTLQAFCQEIIALRDGKSVLIDAKISAAH